jgi:glycine/D-amino acid oxidase-like deaminating enzyme
VVVGHQPYSSDYLIVGAGFVGLCCALRVLQQTPDRKITILDADVAGGATALRSSAMFMRFGFSPLSRRMTRDSAEFYEKVTGFHPGIWEKHPFYWVLNRAAGSQHAETLLNKVVPASDQDFEQIKAQIPNLGLGPDEALFFDPLVHRAKPDKLHAALLAAVLDTGRVKLVEGCSVNAVRDHGSKGVGLVTAFGEFVAPNVAVCIAGAVHSPAFREFFHDNAVRAKKIVSFYIPFHDLSVDPVGLGFLSDQVYLMPDTRKKRWILSVTSDEWDVDPHNHRHGFTADELERAGAYISHRLGMGSARIMGAAVYADAYSDARIPSVLRPGKFGGQLAIATGTAGYGLKIAPALARHVTETEHASTV